jgi:beta-lactamase superfamily II metal-dependent hydrolase
MILKVNTIGDGQFIDMRLHENRLVTDFGSKEAIDNLNYSNFCGFSPFDFALSHFHKDHYSGIVGCKNKKYSVHIDKVYIPRLPKLTKKNLHKTLGVVFKTLNYYVMGNHSGSMEYDFINLIKHINLNKKFKVIPVSQGDFIYLGKKSFEVIWPPKEILDNKDFTTSVEKAVQKLEDLVNSGNYPILKDIYDKIDQKSISFEEEIKIENIDPVSSNSILVPEDKIKIDKNIKDLNSDLRDIANRISLAYCNSQLLFLGDLESHEINKSLDYTFKKHKNKYWDIILFPHHGTHWGKEMENISGEIGVSSIGKTLFKNWEEKNKKIVNFNHLTHCNGSFLREFGLKTYIGPYLSEYYFI